MRITPMLAALAMLVAPVPLAAQRLTLGRAEVVQRPLHTNTPLLVQSAPVASPQGRDSLWNGVATGAFVGGLLGGLVGSGVESNNRNSGKGATVTGIVIGAGLGAGIGAGVDVLLSRRATPSRKLRVTPVVSREVRALSTQLSF